MTLSSFVIPILLIALFIYCAIKKVNCYSTFVSGAKGAIPLCLDILPFLVAIFCAIELFRISGLTNFVAELSAPILNLCGVPSQLAELIIIRPFSGSGSLAILEDIYSAYGPDAYVSRCASVIMGSSETIFYVATVYFSQTKAKKLLYAIPIALICCIIGAIISCLICKIM